MSLHLGAIGTWIVLALLIAVLAMISNVGLGSATHISDVCPEHSHGSMTQDCTNSMGYSSATWYGSGLTDTSEIVDEIWVRITGVEVCNGLIPEFDWWEQNTNNDDWIVGTSGSGGLSAFCLPEGFIANYSYHDASGADFHKGSMDRQHPNPWPH